MTNLSIFSRYLKFVSILDIFYLFSYKNCMFTQKS